MSTTRNGWRPCRLHGGGDEDIVSPQPVDGARLVRVAGRQFPGDMIPWLPPPAIIRRCEDCHCTYVSGILENMSERRRGATKERARKASEFSCWFVLFFYRAKTGWTAMAIVRESECSAHGNVQPGSLQ